MVKLRSVSILGVPMLKPLYLSNLPKFACGEPRSATGHLASGSNQAKVKKSVEGSGTNKLTSAQQQELFEYERATRHNRSR